MSDPSCTNVAIIGAGVAGLSCACAIANADGPVVHLVDQGSRGRGGRTSSSRPTTHEPPMVFDHGCQFFTAMSPGFRKTCLSLERLGRISRWDGRFGALDANTGEFTPKSKTMKHDADFFALLAAEDVFVGVPTMRGLCDGLRELISEKKAVDMPQCTVTSLERRWEDNEKKETRSPWKVRGVDGRRLDDDEHGSTERVLGEFTAVVVTDVMLTKRGTPGSCQLLGVGVGDDVDGSNDAESGSTQNFSGENANAKSTWRRMASLPPSSLFSLMVRFSSDDNEYDDIPFDAVVVTGSKVIQLLVRDSGKPGRRGVETGSLRNWTAVSTSEYATAVVKKLPLSLDGSYNPQTETYLQNVTPTMVEDTIRVLNLASGSKNQKLSSEQVVHARAQRWGHSFPNEGWNGLVMNEKQGFAWDPVLQFGACGDFASGPGVEQAWVSGRNAGNAIVATLAARETGE